MAAGPLVEAAKVFVERLAAMQDAGLRCKTAYVVLHTYAQGCCNHLLRANLEDGQWLDDLEEVLQQGLARVAGSNLNECQRALASLRLSEGGLAFGGLRWRSEAAFLGSWGLVIKEVAARLGADSLEGFSSRCPTVWADIGRAERELRLRGGNGSRALDWVQMFDQPVHKLQGTWAKEISASRREAIISGLPEEDAADARSHGGPGAGSFLCPPCQGGKVMPDPHFKISLRDRLLLPVCQEGARCQHRRPNGAVCNTPLDARGHHAKTCAIGGGWVRRHNGIRDFTASSWAACSGVQACKEQRVPEWDREVIDDQGRMVSEEAVLDVITSDPQSGRPLHLDVTVTSACPSNPAALRRRARRDGAGAADAAAHKRSRYNLAGPSLIPLAFEDGGRPAEETVSFIRRCGAAAERNGTSLPGAGEGDDQDQPIVARLWQEFSTLLQWGNAELILSANGK